MMSVVKARPQKPSNKNRHHRLPSPAKASAQTGASSGTPLFLQSKPSATSPRSTPTKGATKYSGSSTQSVFLQRDTPEKKATPTKPKPLSNAPEKNRKQLFLPSTSISFPKEKTDPFFEKLSGGRWGTKISAPSGLKVELTGIDAAYLIPMTSIAMELNSSVTYASPTTGKTVSGFGPGNIVTLQLALKSHGLTDGNYRFAWVVEGKQQTIYIEALSATAAPTATATVAKDNSSITVGGSTFKLSGWEDSQVIALKQALNLIPAAALTEIDGVTFEIDDGAAPTGEAGHYDDVAHNIKIYSGAAFNAKDSVRYGQSTYAVWAIAHEIGHAIDLAALRKAYDSGSVSNMNKARSESGTAWKAKWIKVEGQKKKKREWNFNERADKKDKKDLFRKAAIKDGVKVQKNGQLQKGVSDYSNTDWGELYAESFALYTTDPSTLKLIRPNIYNYFSKKYP